MSYAIVSLHTANFQPLADYTWPNKVEYAERYGYCHCRKTDGFTLEHPSGEKIPFIKQYLLDNPDVEWAWWLDTDTLITNYTKRIEDYIDNNYHFIISVDVDPSDGLEPRTMFKNRPGNRNNKFFIDVPVNAGSFFVRNSVEGHAYLDWMLSVYDEFAEKHGFFAEQEIINASYSWWDLKPTWNKLIKMCPIHEFNSFDCYLKTYKVDQLGQRVSWEPGDFVVHWPSVTNDIRINHMVPLYTSKIIK